MLRHSAVFGCSLLFVAALPVELAAPPHGSAQAMPIDVVARPSKTLAGGTVTLGGSTAFAGGDASVSVLVRPPGKAPITFTTVPGTDGSWTITFQGTGSLGTYPVEATAPDGKGRATTAFRVVPVHVIPDEVARSADSLASAAAAALDALEGAARALPMSAERDEVEARLAEARARTAEASAQLPAFRQALRQVFEARAAVPEDNAEWDAYVEELETWQKESSQQVAHLETTVAAASAGTQRCGEIDAFAESLGVVSEALTLLTLPLDASKLAWLNRVPPAFVARAGGAEPSAEARFAAVTTMKTAAAALEGPQGMLLAAAGFVVDLAQFAAQQLFDIYCEKFEGTLAATFIGESFTTSGEPFFDYTTSLDGRVVLLYEKNASASAPVGLLGYLEGNGWFDVRDNPEPIVSRTPGVVLFHTVISPPGGRYWTEAVHAARTVLPHSFRIPLEGTLHGDSIVLAVKLATYDFSDLIVGRAIYVVMPLGGLVPEVINSPISLQKAHSILERVIRRRPVLHVTRGGGGAIAQGVFARDTTNATGTARVRTQLTLKACNPGCVPFPYTPASKPE